MGDPNAAMFSRSLPAWCAFVPLAMIGSLKGSGPPPIAAAAPSCKAVQFGGPLYAGEPMASLSAPLPGYGAPPIIPSSSFWFKPTPRTSLSAWSRLANSWAFLVLLLNKIKEVKKLFVRIKNAFQLITSSTLPTIQAPVLTYPYFVQMYQVLYLTLITD